LSRWRIERLAERHSRGAFDCGVESLNVFLRAHAGQNARKDVSRTYVASCDDSDEVAGYYTISSGSVAFVNLPEGPPRHADFAAPYMRPAAIGPQKEAEVRREAA
jgi:hypothetical protein